MARPGEETEIETLTTGSPQRLSPLEPRSKNIVTSDMNDASRASSTIDSNDSEAAAHYARHAGTEDDDSEDSEESSMYSYESVTGEMACCFSLPKCNGFVSNEFTSTTTYYSHITLILTSFTMFVSASVVWLLLGYLAPACLCSELYSHLYFLPFLGKLAIFAIFVYFLTLFCISIKVCRSILIESADSTFAYAILLGLTVIGSVIGNIYAIAKSGGWSSYLIYNDRFYNGAGAMFLKSKFFTAIAAFSEISQAQNIEEVVQMFVVEEGVAQIEAVERVAKFAILGGWFLFNFVLIAQVYFLTHYRSCLPLCDELSDASDTESVATKRSSKSGQSYRSGASRRSKKAARKAAMTEPENPPSYRDLSPPRSDYTSVTKRSAYSMRTRPGYHRATAPMSANQSFAQHAFSTSRSRHSLAGRDQYQTYHHSSSTVGYHPRAEYTNTGSRRNGRNITKTEDFLLP